MDVRTELRWMDPAPTRWGSRLALASLALPIAALIGAVLVGKNEKAAGALMGGSAALMIVVFGVGFFSLIPVVLLTIAAVISLQSKPHARN